MKYRIIRGKNQIGGTITEIVSEDKLKIWIDFGSELPTESGISTDQEMIELMKDKTTRPDAVFFTHIHGDHIGLLEHIPDDVDIFLGPVAKKMLDNINNTLINNKFVLEEDKKNIQKNINILNNEKRVTFYKNKQPSIYSKEGHKTISFLPIMVDHSVYDSYMLRFDVDGQSLVHTGDFRAHGRLGINLFEDIKLLTNTPVDILVTEGTMMSRQKEKVLTENEMEKEAIELLKNNKYVFLICSSTNMESLASFYRAMIKNNDKRIFYCNSYVKKQLELYTEEVGKDFQFDRIALIEYGNDFYKKLKEDGFVMLVGGRKHYRNIMKQFKEDNPILIYSMWNGYITEGKRYSSPELIKTVNLFDNKMVKKLHTSGHATPKIIAKVIKEINPRKEIIPVHTENAVEFLNLVISDDLKEKIKILEEYEMSENFGDKNINDNRAKIAEITDEMKKKDGAFYEFLNFVKKHKELEICFRGNSKPQQITIYYHNHKVWQLEKKSDKEFKVTISINHARYCSDWSERLKTLYDKKGIFNFYVKEEWKKPKKKKNTNSYTICGNGYISTIKERYSKEFVEQSYDIIKPMIDKFFEPVPKIDYFKDYFEKRNEKIVRQKYIEKVAQQEIYRYFKNGVKLNDNNYLCLYDLEFAQKGRSSTNQPDSLGIIYDSTGIKKIALVEVKSTKSALEGSSGLIPHCNKMNEYVARNNDIQNRIDEAKDYMLLLQELGLRNYQQLTKCQIEDIPNIIKSREDFAKIIIFTDDTINIYEKNKYIYDKIAKDSKCSIIKFKYDYEETLKNGYSSKSMHY